MQVQKSTKIRKTRTRTSNESNLIVFRHFRNQNKDRKVIPESERLIKEKNEWGDYKVNTLQIKQLEKAHDNDLNKSVSEHFKMNSLL